MTKLTVDRIVLIHCLSSNLHLKHSNVLMNEIFSYKDRSFKTELCRVWLMNMELRLGELTGINVCGFEDFELKIMSFRRSAFLFQQKAIIQYTI